jgi:hypothetical protein
MKNIAGKALIAIVSLATSCAPAMCQDFGGCQPQVPGLVMPFGAPAGQPAVMQPQFTAMQPQFAAMQPQFNGMQPQFNQAAPQFNQMIMPAQVPFGTAPGAPANQTPHDPYFNTQVQEQQSYATAGSLQPLSPYQQQEMALEQAQMAQQLEDLKQRHELDESFRNQGEFNDNGKFSDDPAPAKKSKVKGVANSLGKLVKESAKYAAPVGGAVGSFFILRAALGSNPVMVMPAGGGMMFAP